MPMNVVAALLGVLALIICLSVETAGLDGAAELFLNGPLLPEPADSLALGLYGLLRDWQVLIGAFILLLGLRAWLPHQAAPRPALLPALATPVMEPRRDRQERGSAVRRLDAALRQLEAAIEAVRLEVRNSVQGSFMAFQVKGLLALPSPGLESLGRDIGMLEPEVIYLFYRLQAKLDGVRAVQVECTGQHIVALTEEVEVIMHHLRRAFEGGAAEHLMSWPPPVTLPAAEPRHRVRQETT
ncbi:MAG TPA: hypothetical protein VM689_18955 [Aliidongia sp.]|nr:hypothetical protein [Aliidongia sp.]